MVLDHAPRTTAGALSSCGRLSRWQAVARVHSYHLRPTGTAESLAEVGRSAVHINYVYEFLRCRGISKERWTLWSAGVFSHTHCEVIYSSRINHFRQNTASAAGSSTPSLTLFLTTLTYCVSLSQTLSLGLCSPHTARPRAVLVQGCISRGTHHTKM